MVKDVACVEGIQKQFGGKKKNAVITQPYLIFIFKHMVY